MCRHIVQLPVHHLLTTCIYIRCHSTSHKASTSLTHPRHSLPTAHTSHPSHLMPLFVCSTANRPDPTLPPALRPQQGSPPRDAWRGSSSHERPASARPSSAARGRPPASEHPRRPASASPNVVPPDRYLGPAAGKVQRGGVGRAGGNGKRLRGKGARGRRAGGRQARGNGGGHGERGQRGPKTNRAEAMAWERGALMDKILAPGMSKAVCTGYSYGQCPPDNCKCLK